MSLAELLKADLEDLEDDDEELEEDNDYKNDSKQRKTTNDASASYGDIEDVGMEVENMGIDTELTNNLNGVDKDSVKVIARLLESDKLNKIISQIDFYKAEEKKLGYKSTLKDIVGPVEQDKEYKLIVEANNLTVEIDSEINVIHKYIRDKYSKRFPELESLVPNAMLDYIKCVKELGNNVENAKNNENLQQFLPQATIMVVSVSASTTQGVKLSENELTMIYEACDISIKLNETKAHIFEYVESRMTFIAPNLSIIIGASTAAKLMGIAGGLTNLSRMPACNLLLLGQQKKALSGFTTVQIIPHTGFVYHSDLIQSVPPDLRRQVARIVAAKCTLASRIDSFHHSRDGIIGTNLRSEINTRIEKLQEPPPVKLVKPLVAPIEAARKKRGGRRARKIKERLGTTELRKQANRMTFGEIQEDAYQDDLNFSTGQIGKSGSGIRATQVDSKTKARISQKLQKTVNRQNQWGGTSTVKKTIQSGTASSVAFTTLQGLEIVNPNAREKDSKGTESQKYFSSASGFTKVLSVMPKMA
jgi:U4/U6 small nuclear ribonucleoprotein PRP31